jgi:hypothetical protein
MDGRVNVFVSRQGLKFFSLLQTVRVGCGATEAFSAVLNFANTLHLIPRLSMIGNRQFLNIAG